MLDKQKKEVFFESSQIGHSIEYSIGDLDMAILVARDKLYTFPIRTLTQEYIANAYDACVEAGTDPSKIQISVPSVHGPVMKIRDFGLGLSPERVSEVFTQYFKSTKRRSKKQAGFFGIGAKSAFAYSGCDSFTVISYYNKQKTVYVAHLGQSKRGTFTCMAVEPSDEPSGVSIEIAVQLSDIVNFIDAIKRAIFLWPKRPITSLALPNPTYQGDGFRIFRKSDIKFLQANTTVVVAADGMTPYEMPGQKFLDNHVLVLDLPAAWMGIAPSRETFSEHKLVEAKIAEIWKECTSIIRTLAYSGDFRTVIDVGLPGGISVEGGTKYLVCPEFVTVSVRKSRKLKQHFSVISGLPVLPSSSADVFIALELALGADDNKRARYIWLKARSSVRVCDSYSVIIVCANAEYIGPVQDISKIVKAYDSKTKSISATAPKVRKPVGSIPATITDGRKRGNGYSDTLQRHSSDAVKIFTSSAYTKLLAWYNIRLAHLPNDKRVQEAAKLGYETDKEYCNRYISTVDHQTLYLAALVGSGQQLRRMLSLCNRFLGHFSEWPKELISNEIETSSTVVATPVLEFLSSNKKRLPDTYYNVVKSMFPLIDPYLERDLDNSLYLEAKFRHLVANPNEDMHAFLSLTQQLSSSQHLRTDVQPDQ